ncbi:hypothetical protein PAEPH01_0743 [Pancytospora epiphaga]|nr:hypothetical protein PAEPH01_0743 [Pancytospora epiphaga]
MKKIVGEFPIILLEEAPMSTLFRFPCSTKSLQMREIKYKPSSGNVELKTPFPHRNMSAIKLKILKSEYFTYRSHPTPLENHYSVYLKDGRFNIRKIQKVYIFDPDHQYYEVATQNSTLKKAESREELEHRKKNINYKLRNIENEEPRTLKFEDMTSKYPNSISVNEGEMQGEMEVFSALSKLSVKPERTRVEEMIKHARICNLKNLIEIFGDETIIKNTLFKMTEKIAGRFVLRNSYYEKDLWEPRARLLDIFKEKNGRIPISDTLFLGEESWLANEIAKKVEREYVLYGFEEDSGFDIEALERINRMAVRSTLSCHRMLNVEGICAHTSLDSDIVLRFLSEPGYICLANNSYVLEDDTYWFNSVLKAYESKKCMELTEIEAILSGGEDTHNHDEIVAEVKLYCNQRNSKYYLKIIK